MSLSQSSNLRLVASDGAIIDRRRRPRTSEPDGRSRGRLVEFAGTIAILATLATGAAAMARQAMLRPFAAVDAALAPR